LEYQHSNSYKRYVLANQDLIATVACLDSGKTKVDASFGEILVTTEKIQWTLKHGEKALRPSKRPTNFMMMYKTNSVHYEPLGVVAACVSWNYPFHNLLGPIISALFAGNAIVVKTSERTAWSTAFYTSIVRGALTACGHSPALVQPLLTWPNAANHLTSHPDIAHITFIGSRPVAHHVCASAAKSLTPVCVELGGKDPAIVLDDVSNLKSLCSVLMRGVFQSAGQNCIGIERIVALPKSYTTLISILEPRIRNLRLGSVLDDAAIDVGAMISADSFDRLEELIADAVKQGARCLVGGKRYNHPKYPQGHYFTPTLVVDVTPSMRIAQEELFAPVCTLMRAESVADAIRIANSTPFALGASVFGTRSADLDAVVHGVKAGMVSVNDFAVYYLCQLPFGGVKGSGYGRFAGEEGLRGLCNLKSVSRDWIPGVATSIPGVVDYEIKDAGRAWRFVTGIVELATGMGLWERARGLARLIRNG
jgi:acyl-CoA reductase-like NAD-dependent aldehyde dehydrogenase